MDPKLQRTLLGLRLTMRTAKGARVTEAGVGGDLDARLVTAVGDHVIGAYRLCGDAGPETVLTTIALSDCDTAIFCTDVYLALDGRSGDLGQRFASGDPGVGEALVQVACIRSGALYVLYDQYHYDGNRIVWPHLPQRPTTGISEGVQPVARVMRAAFAHQRKRHGPALIQPGSGLIHLGGTDLVDGDTVVAFALISPCPCGSERPMSECCSIRN